MALGQDEVVPVFPIGMCRIDLHGVPVQGRQSLHNRQTAAKVAIPRVKQLHQGQTSDRLC